MNTTPEQNRVDVDNPFAHGFSHEQCRELQRSYDAGEMSKDDFLKRIQSPFEIERWMMNMLVRTELKEKGRITLSDGWFEEIDGKMRFTSMNQPELTAGVELDVLVEREIFGKAWVKHPYVVVNGTRREIETWLEEGENPDDPSPGTFAGKEPPKRSSNLVSAWQVTEKMKTAAPDFVAYSHFNLLLQGITALSAEQAALAICLAAIETFVWARTQ